MEMPIGHVLCPICKSPRVRMIKDSPHTLKVVYRCNDCGAQWINEDKDDVRT
jgi:transposase-like protein